MAQAGPPGAHKADPRVARRSGSLTKRGCPRGPAAANESELQGGEGALRKRPA